MGESAAHGMEGSPVKLVPIPGTSLIAAVAPPPLHTPLHGSSPGSSQRGGGLERSVSTSMGSRRPRRYEARQSSRS